jgi:hypothetical protein
VTQYLESRLTEMQMFVEQCERRYGMKSHEFVKYYRELESYGTEEQYQWWVYLSFLGMR